MGIVDISGNLVVKYSYDAYGKCTLVSDTSNASIGRINPFRFKGYYLDSETGFYYCKSRYYVPDWGRWFTADSINYLDPASVNGMNLYAYCKNNPISYYDPSGHIAVSIILTACLGLAGAIAGGILGYCTAKSEGQDISKGILTGVILGALVGVIIGIGGMALSGAVSSVLSKGITDIVNVALFEGEFGTWEDYAVAFVFGALTRKLGSVTGQFAKLAKGAKFVADVAVRPLVNQVVKIGTRGDIFDREKFFNDVIMRTLTYGDTDCILNRYMFGLDIKIDFKKCLLRASLGSLY